jgi:hypothetical protein
MSTQTAPADFPRQVAQSAAGEAIEALLSAFWADSFNAEGLEVRLVETIYPFIQDARRLHEHHPTQDEGIQHQSGATVIRFGMR